MRKWIIFFIVIVLGGLIFVAWEEEKKDKEVVKILDRIPFVDSILVKDGKSEEKLLDFTSSDSSFLQMVNVYQKPYYDLKWSEKKLLKEEPFIVIEYLRENLIQYKVIIYQVQDANKYMLTSEYIYSSEEDNSNNTFVINETDQLLGVNQGLKELLNTVVKKGDK